MGQPVVHFEIGSRNSAETAKFFGELFGWHTQQMGPAHMIDTGSKAGIQGHFSSLGHEPHTYVTVYVEVDDIGAYLKKAESLGGKTLVPQVDIDAGSFAWIADLEGNIIGLWKPKAA